MANMKISDLEELKATPDNADLLEIVDMAPTPTSKKITWANIKAAVWTEATGTGAPVRATSPTLVTPILGTPTSGDLQNCTVAGTTLLNLVQQYYGVSWDESADTYVRTGSTAGQTCGVTLADAFLPVHRRMRGCVVADDGTVNYYLCATDWTKKEDGTTASTLTEQTVRSWLRYLNFGIGMDILERLTLGKSVLFL